MHLKINSCKYFTLKCKSLFSHVVWDSFHGILTSGDSEILLWDLQTENFNLYFSLPSYQNVTCFKLHFDFLNSKHSEILVIATTEGRLFILKKGGQLERIIDAHNGSICSVEWNQEGNSFASGGEDGVIKIWSRLGMHRATSVLSDAPIFSLSWSPDNDQFVYTKSEYLVIKSLHQSSIPVIWKAHDCIILSLDWGKKSGKIISGDEEGVIKVWNSFGVLHISTIVYGTPICNLTWSPDNFAFAVGGNNLYLIFNRYFCIRNMESSTNFGHICNIAWSYDGTQVAFPTKHGLIHICNTILLDLKYYNFSIQSAGISSILVRDLSLNRIETFDTTTRILQAKVGFGYLIILTKCKFLIYSLNRICSPVEIDLTGIQFLHYFLLTDSQIILFTTTNTYHVFNYDGSSYPISIVPSNVFSLLHRSVFSFKADTLAIRDIGNISVINIFDNEMGKYIKSSSISHILPILSVYLSPKCNNGWRLLGFIDKEHDLYIFPLMKNNLLPYSPKKVASFINSFLWNDKYTILAANQNDSLIFWYNPYFIFTDPDIYPFSVIKFADTVCFKDSHLTDFVGSICTIRLYNGSLYSVPILPHYLSLTKYLSADRWEEGHRLSMIIQNIHLWSCLALSATSKGILHSSKFAYANCLSIDKVEFFDNYLLFECMKGYYSFIMKELKIISSNPSNDVINYVNIQKCIKTFNWDRALTLSIKSESHIDTIIALRVKHLHCLSLDETRKKFKQFSDLEIDWEKISSRLSFENKRI